MPRQPWHHPWIRHRRVLNREIDINMDIGSVNTLKLVNCFHFQVMPLKNIHNYMYVAFHNLSTLLTIIVTLYHRSNVTTRAYRSPKKGEERACKCSYLQCAGQNSNVQT